jgi:hypothetical protein
LSHAFGCEPAELLQEVSHDSRVVTPVEFNKRRRAEMITRESSIPLYSICANDSNTPSALTIKACSPNEWRQRPMELFSKNDVFAIKAETYFKPYFSSSSILYLEPSTNLAPDSTVVILKQGEIMIKKIWSVTPTSLQLCDIGDIETMKECGDSVSGKLVDIDRRSLDAVYKVVGYSDFNIC